MWILSTDLMNKICKWWRCQVLTVLISSYKSSILNQYNVRTCIYAYPVRQDYKNTHIIDNSQASTYQLKLSKQYMGALLLSKFKVHSD